jgi:biotin transport system ATP-binding protein
MSESQGTRGPIIRTSNLTHRFADGTLGLDSITLTVWEGELVVISGRNGSGKTLLARHLNGLLEPTTGWVELAGEPVSKNPARARQLVGLIFQDSDSQIVGETVSEDVAFGPRNLRLDREEIEERVDRSIRSVGLAGLEERPAHLLSGGEKRCLAVAGVLALNPRVVVFDEPFSNLDYPATRRVLGQIVDLHRGGHTVVVITHDLDRILAHADRLILMESGRIARDGRPADVIEDVELFGVRKPGSSIEELTWLDDD